MIRDEHEMIIENKPSALDIHELSLRESFDRAWRESHEVKEVLIFHQNHSRFQELKLIFR